jgi:uncharacterized protein YecE (DUF72 family)
VIRIGTSGWLYPPWRGVFYPKGLPHRRELEHLSRRVNSVEINGSFYALQKPESYQRWAAEVPDDFVFAVKGGRFITHMKRLREPETVLANFFASGLLALGAKLGPILWQTPANLPFDLDVVDHFLATLPRTTTEVAALAARHDERLEGRALVDADAERPVRHAMEVRHTGFKDPAFPRLLREHGVACVIADTAGTWPVFDEVTADFVYVRLHGDEELYASGYTDDALERWSKRIRTWATDHDVFVYFDNDMKVKAPGDAMALLELLTPMVD